MFTRARLHLTLAYAGLLAVTVILVAGAIGLFAVREARNTDDRELQIRAAAIEAAILQGPIPHFSSPPPPPPDGGRGPGPHFEERGLLEYVMPVVNGQLLLPPDLVPSGLPDVSAAQQAYRSGRGEYRTNTVQGSEVRLYSLPVLRNGQPVAVVQVVRSRYFVNAAVSSLVLIALVAGLVGLVLSGAAGYWLAGRTLRPIAQALERQRNFAADASHELRTPLTVMLTNAELLTLHPERRLSEYQDVVADIIAEIQRLSRLVTDLLTLARADQRKAAPTRVPVDLSEIAITVGRQFGSVASDKGLALEAEVQPRVVVIGDRDRLQQLAVILIDNAVRYTRSGSVCIRVAQHGGDAQLSVGDTGPGIAPEHLPHLFERFYRTDSARSGDDGGTGLGLALAQWIVESHDGHIEVASTPGQGSTFTAHLHAVRGRHSSDGAQAAEPLVLGRTGRVERD